RGETWFRNKSFPADGLCSTLTEGRCSPRPNKLIWSGEGRMNKIMLAVSAAALALLTYDDALAQAGFPPPPPKVSPAAGVIDMHVHSHPDVFGRNMDDIDVAQLAKVRGMRGIVLKNHISQTASRAPP